MSRRLLTTSTTYTLAHTAQCKLKLAANRPDRNLRFVLGHAFTLDNLMLRIVEIENQSAKSVFHEATPTPGDEHFDCTKPTPIPEPEEHYDCTQAGPTPAEPEPRPRRISFQDNNARPSNTVEGGSNSPARKRSPPPVSIHSAQNYPDEDGSDRTSSDGTSSDDYDEPDSYGPDTKKPKQWPVHDAYPDEEDAGLEIADDELNEDEGLNLQRFESASSRPPGMIRSSSSSSEEDGNEAISPPQLPSDVDVRKLLEGDKDAELADLYESVRRCSCHGQRDSLGGTPTGMWDVPVEKSGEKHLAVVALAA
ncbi:uncharacterized protein Z518_04158 [Rhinocladiella mackenziei CBS 650.93]|uniref:Uncharacterized protein n=1 Tax=Rhinocladiella mackenziei CBS 650.93 TaxID=1442369 RepID=A0A0D2IKE7_9EURO|nr:uncharacterized protein Z518_04158 [Rhinocladiella mackenziei CBS 650.93]KIX06184.1 hypothetical protein Z518_04158 [Rhinocladiella mackenziei CBS 650.93]